MDYSELKRRHEKAKQDKNPRRFLVELRESIKQGHFRPSDFSFQSLFETFVPDGAEFIREYCNPQHDGGVQLYEAIDAVSTTDFRNITGQIIFTEMMDQFEREDLVFSKIVRNIPTKFNGEKIPSIGRIGDKAEVVGEGEEYPTVGLTEEYRETPQLRKRGNKIKITREALFFDHTNLILDAAREIGEWLAVNKEIRIIDAFIDENSTRHRFKYKGTAYASYQTSTPWVNSKTSNALLDHTSIEALRILFSGLRDRNTGFPINVRPRHLVFTSNTYMNAMRTLNATSLSSNTTGYPTNAAANTAFWDNMIKSMGLTPVTSELLKDRLATDTDWFLSDIEKTVEYRENWPLTVTQAPAGHDDEFDRDIVIQFKASEKGDPNVREPMASVKSAQ